MGSSHSKDSKSTTAQGQGATAKTKATGTHTPLPEDVQPYQGVPLECLLVTVPVQMSSNYVSGFTAGKTAVTSNVDDYYPTIANYLQQGYTLNTFYRVPGAASTSGFGQVQMAFEALYSRAAGVTQSPEGTRLLVEKSTMHLQYPRGGILSKSKQRGTVADTSDIMNRIVHHSSMGGRLICLKVNGQVTTQGMSAAMSGIGAGIGVDVLFEVPIQPTAAKFVYQVINVPIGVTIKMGLRNRAEVHCDWLGTLGTYLKQGWKLVEIFLDQSQQQAGASMNSVWFFEKKSSKLHDPSMVYEGAVIEYWHKVSVVFGGTSVKTDWSPVIVEMGQRGWELACIQETPETVYSGFSGKYEVKLLMFFQRKIVGGVAGEPPPYLGPPSAINPAGPSPFPPGPPSEAPYPPVQPYPGPPADAMPPAQPSQTPFPTAQQPEKSDLPS